MRIKTTLLALGMILSMGASAVPQQASATPVTQFAVCASGAQNFFGIQPWYACLPKNTDGSPKITKLNDIFLVVFPVVESLVKIGVLVAAGVIFFMLIKIMVARGNAGQIATAVSGIRDAVIGLVISLISIALVNFIAGAFPS